LYTIGTLERWRKLKWRLGLKKVRNPGDERVDQQCLKKKGNAAFTRGEGESRQSEKRASRRRGFYSTKEAWLIKNGKKRSGSGGADVYIR